MVLGYGASLVTQMAQQKWDRELRDRREREIEARAETTATELEERLAALEAWRLEIERVRGSAHADHERYNQEIQSLWDAIEKRRRPSS